MKNMENTNTTAQIIKESINNVKQKHQSLSAEKANQIIDKILNEIPTIIKQIKLEKDDKYIYVGLEFNKNGDLIAYYFTEKHNKDLSSTVTLKKPLIKNTKNNVPEDFFKSMKKEKKNIVKKIGAISTKSIIYVKEEDWHYAELCFKI